HEEREMGFRGVLSERFPGLEVVGIREDLDDWERSYAEARALLRRVGDLGGIYNLGAGDRGIAQAVEEAGRAGEVVYVGHELTEQSRQLLLSGTMDAVIDQNPEAIAAQAVDRLARAAMGDASSGSVIIPTRVIFRENIP